MIISNETASPNSVLRSSGSREEVVGALLAIAGVLLLAVAPSVPLSMVALGLLVAGGALRPDLGPPLLGLTLPFYLLPRRFGSLSFSMPELILASALLGAALFALRKRVAGGHVSVGDLATPLDRPIALFLGAALLSLLASEVLRVSLRDLRTLVLEPVAAYYLIAWFFSRPADRSRLLAGLLLGGTLAAAMGMYQYLFTDHVVVVEGTRRILGPYLSPNHLALYLGRLLPIALAAALYLPGLRWAGAFLVAVLIAALLLTFSLGAWLASSLAVSIVVSLWLKGRSPAASASLAQTAEQSGSLSHTGRNRRGTPSRGRAMALLAVIAAAVATSVPLLNLERVSSHFSFDRGTSFMRLQLWESALQMIRDHPLLGVGMDNFLYHYRSGYLLPEAAAEPNLSHPHNLILNFWLQIGILGVVAIAWLAAALGRMWYRLWRSPLSPSDRAVMAGISGAAANFLIHGMVDNSYFVIDLAFQFWLLAGIVVALWRAVDASAHLPSTGQASIR